MFSLKKWMISACLLANCLICTQVDLNHIEELCLRGELEEAAKIAERLLQSDSISSEITDYLTHKTLWLNFELKKYERVIALSDESDSFSLLLKAHSLKKLNRFQEAEEIFQKFPDGLATLEHNDASLLGSYFDAKDAESKGELLKALKILDEALASNPQAPLLDALLCTYGAIAFSCLENSNLSTVEKEVFFQKGCSAYQKAIQGGNLDAEIPFAKACLYYVIQGGKIDDELAIQNSKSTEVKDLLSIFQTEKNSDFQAKETFYGAATFFQEEALLLRVKNLIKWGHMLMQKGFSDEGNEKLKKAASLIREGTFHRWNEAAMVLLADIAVMTDIDFDDSLLNEKTEGYRALFNFKRAPSHETAQKLMEKAYSLESLLVAQTLFDQGYIKEAQSILVLNNPEALFLAARIAENENRTQDKRDLLKELIEKYPSHPLIDEAEFMVYTLAEYLQGGRKEMKHLEHLAHANKASLKQPLIHYLIGLDCKKDRKTETGKWVRKKSLTEAIDAFALSAASYAILSAQNLIPKARTEALKELAYCAHLEQGYCNFEIAVSAKGAKRQLYLEYAHDIFKELASDKNFPKLNQEAYLSLAEVRMQLGDYDSANDLLCHIITHNKDPYCLAKARFFLATALIEKKEYEKALITLESVQEGVHLLSTDEALKATMNKGFCLKALGKLDEAMIAYSQVVNANAVSHLRIESCFERACLYKEQNRLDLHRKQLEAILKLDGPWHLKARQLLDEHYAKDPL